jgi:hypothetical protein
MLSKNFVSMLAVAALAVGCNLDDDSKNSCNVEADCLTGYQCVNSTCVGGGGGVDAPSSSGAYFGTVEAMAPVSAGIASTDGYDTLAAATTVTGTLGCAVVGDLQASPGPGAVAYAMVHASSGDRRCPNGTFAIVNDPNLCKQTFASELREGCGLYKRWDSSGNLVANQLAVGGYVSVQETYVTDMESRCNTEISIRFAGGITIAKTFSFSYNPLAPTSKFCKNG